MTDLVPSNATIKRTVKYYERLKEQAYYEYEALLKRLNEEIATIRKSCGHPAETLEYNPDPSGNNDTSYTCGVCGLEKRWF